MKKFILLNIFIVFLFANDSEYRTSGNQLIPIESTNIKLEKEILRITLNKDGTFNVSVNYILFNEGEERNITIGFEAPKSIGVEPQGYFGFSRNDALLLESEQRDIKVKPKIKGHESIYDFRVLANDITVPYKVVDSSVMEKDKHTSIYVGYLYYFQMKLKKGANTLRHYYRLDGQSSVHFYYEFGYILETARRWKGGKIDDFTLILDMGKGTQFSIDETFFSGSNQWRIDGVGTSEYFMKTCDTEECQVGYHDRMAFYIDEGKAVYHKKDFIPRSAIFLEAEINYFDIFDSKKNILWIPHNFALPALATDAISLKILKSFLSACQGDKLYNEKVKQYYTTKVAWYKEGEIDKRSWPTVKKYAHRWLKKIERNKRKILLNLPFAKRGYIFKNYALSTFFKHQKWYKPNKNYKPHLSDLRSRESKWRNKIVQKDSIGDEDFFRLIDEYLNF